MPTLQLVPVDAVLADLAANIASDEAMRGMDAIYVAVAQRYQCTLVSLDKEILTRATRIVPTKTPADVLRAMSNL